MFKPNKRHLQPFLITNINDLPEKHRKLLENSWANTFYHELFCRLKEEPFADLFADHPSRPNTPINWLVALEILKSAHGWSDEELYEHFLFDLQVRYALGLHDLHEGYFDLRTLYYFRERLSRYSLEHGVNLLNQAFEDITDEQLKSLKVRTGTQRMDSTQIASNIMNMSRLQLLVEALQRVYRMLSEADQKRYGEIFAPYLLEHSGQYVYRIKGKGETEDHLQRIGEVIVHLLDELKADYAQEPTYQVLQRVFEDNFRLEAANVQSKTNEELESGNLQSVDDLEATYRKKGQKKYKGYVANLTETCDPENKLQLITKVQVAPNNVDDVNLLVDALPDLKERTGLDTLHTDGAFAGPTADPVLQKHGVEQIQSGIRGREPDPEKLYLADFEIGQDENGVPIQITCPQGQTIAVQQSRQKKGYLADFDPHICQICQFYVEGQCPARPGKYRPTHRITFPASQVAVAQRRRKARAKKKEARNHRAAIEGTVHQVKHPFPAGKLPVRGLFRVTCMMVASAAMANVRRIHCYKLRKQKDENQENRVGQGRKGAQDHKRFSFSLFLTSFPVSFKRAFTLSMFCFDC
jgi:hypothetical protein